MWTFNNVGISKTPITKFFHNLSKKDKENLDVALDVLHENEDVQEIYTNAKIELGNKN